MHCGEAHYGKSQNKTQKISGKQDNREPEKIQPVKGSPASGKYRKEPGQVYPSLSISVTRGDPATLLFRSDRHPYHMHPLFYKTKNVRHGISDREESGYAGRVPDGSAPSGGME